MIVCRPGMTQQFQGAVIVGSAKKHQASLGMALQVQSPVGSDGAPWRGGFGARCMSLAGSSDVAVGAFLESAQGRMLEASPHFGLPTAIEAFDGGLEAGFARRDENGNHLQAEAKADDATQGIGIKVGTLKARVIVELSIRRQAKGSPMAQNEFQSVGGTNGLARPGGCRARKCR
jgi:hypothetical protein